MTPNNPKPKPPCRYEGMHIGDAGAVQAGWRRHWDSMLEAGAAAAQERSAELSSGRLEGMPQQCLEVGGWAGRGVRGVEEGVGGLPPGQGQRYCRRH